MLKDITLGQYFPGNSLIHRLDPRSKILAVLIYIVALFLAKNALSYALLAAALLVCVAISRVKPAALFKGLKPLLFIVVFTALLNLFYIRTGEVLFSWWKLVITVDGVQTAIFMVLRIVLLVSSTFMLTYTTAPMALTDGLESLLSPLKVFHAPVHEFAMMMSIAMRFIPTLVEEADKIMNAQKARGADFENGRLTERAKALLPLLIPLFVSAFRRADELAVAMESRCYHGGEGRTRLKQLKMAACDWLFLLLSSALVVGVILLKRVTL